VPLPPPAIPSIIYTFVGNGFLPNTAYVFIVFQQNDPGVFTGVLTNATGSFTSHVDVGADYLYKFGTFPAGINGGVTFVIGVFNPPV